MNHDDYLWDRTSPPDPTIARLENLLSPLGHQPRTPPRSGSAWRVGLLAAAALIILAILWPKSEPTTWRLNDQPLRRGDIVEQGRVLSATVGSLDVAPGSRLRLEGKNRFRLERGTLRALVWAPPREFVIDTPAATAVDLGCAYTLEVTPNGGGLLSVLSGWVALGGNNLESFVPSGASCLTRPGKGPGTPFYQDASPALRDHLARFDSGDTTALPGLLAATRSRDAITLWHLIPRTSGPARTAVITQLGRYIAIPNPAALERNTPAAMDQAWSSLGLGATSWWRGWKQNF